MTRTSKKERIAILRHLYRHRLPTGPRKASLYMRNLVLKSTFKHSKLSRIRLHSWVYDSRVDTNVLI